MVKVLVTWWLLCVCAQTALCRQADMLPRISIKLPTTSIKFPTTSTELQKTSLTSNILVTVAGREEAITSALSTTATSVTGDGFIVTISNGKDAPRGRFPYACSLRSLGTRAHRCGGTLIAPEWVLSAAHCFVGDNTLGPKPLVYVGAHEINDEVSAEVILAAEVIIHESYTSVDNGFDIALVRLKEPSTRQPMEVAPSGQPLGEGQLLATAGWGRTSAEGPLADVLQFSEEVLYVSNENCQKGWPFLEDNMMCAFSESRVCEGDSGGPLILADSKRGTTITDGNSKFDLLVGIVSFGLRGCASKKADVFTRVSSFQHWIEETMKIFLNGMTEQPQSTLATAKVNCVNNCDELDRELYFAAGTGATREVKDLLAKGANASTRQGKTKDSPLRFAARGGHLDVVLLLLEGGADINGQDEDGVTALHLAVDNNHQDVVELLFRGGAAVDSKTEGGFTPLMFAAINDNADVAGLLLKSGADIEAQSDKGSTPLHLASQEGRLGMAEFLIEAGADVNARNDIDETPLHHAADANNPTMIHSLLGLDADIDAQDEFGFTPVFLGALYGSDDAVEVLKQAGADLTIKDSEGRAIEQAICGCLLTPTGSSCKEGVCSDGGRERIAAILEG